MHKKRISFSVIIFVFIFVFDINCDVITNRKRSDGFGAQFEDIIAAIFYAEITNNEFVYTPITEMEHNYESDPFFLEKKEWLMNIRKYFPVNKNLSLQNQFPSNDIYEFFHNNREQFTSSVSLQKIKRCFRANKNIDTVLSKDRFNIAIHMRRPNAHDTRIYGSDLSDDIYINILEKLRKKYKDKNPLFYICSQGDLQEFNKKFPESDIKLCINASVEDTFMKMVFSDVLVSTTSAFSYVAGYLCEGQVYYFPFGGHTPLPGWVNANDI